MLRLNRNLFQRRNNWRYLTDEEMDEGLAAAREIENLNRLEALNQQQRRQRRLAQMAKAGEFAAKLAGEQELAELLGEGGDIAGKGAKGVDPNALRRSASNFAGRTGQKIGDKGMNVRGQKVGGNLSKGQAAALGGAISGALQGEGVKGVAESAAGWWTLNFAFGFLTIGSFTVLGFLGALLYLDLHFIISMLKKGQGFFVSMNLWQKIILMIANLIVALIPLMFILVVYTATCGSYWFSTGVWIANKFTFGYVEDVCGDLNLFEGGRSGGGGAGTSFWEPSDLVNLSTINGLTVDSQTSDPRIRQCMVDEVERIVAAARSAGLNFVVTSAFRSGDFPSRHAYGEALDFALRPVPGQPWSTNAQIRSLVSIARSAGFVPPAGDTLDEYNSPVERTSGGHVHIEFNKISAQASNCGPYANAPAPVY